MGARHATGDGIDRGDMPDGGNLDALMPASAQRMQLQAGTELFPAENVYFPLDGVATLLLQRDRVRFQIGFGRRGDAIGIHRLFVADLPEISARVLRSGSFICVRQQKLRELMRKDQSLKARLSSYAMRAMAQYLDEAARAVALTLERRVAYWIGRYGETLASDIIPITHHDLAYALGVRRSGVTVALHVLEGQHLIRSRRARIEVIDGKGLAAFSRPQLS